MQQRGGDALPAPGRRHCDVHHVPRVDVPREDEVPDELAPLVHRAERERARLRELDANIVLDQGVLYDARSICSIASRSASSRRRSSSSSIISATARRPGCARRSARSTRPARTSSRGGRGARARHVPRVVIGWDARAAFLQHLPVADGAVPDAQAPADLTCSGATAPRPGTKTSPPRRRSQGSPRPHRPRARRGSRRRRPRSRARGRARGDGEADPHAGEAPGPRPDDEPVEVGLRPASGGAHRRPRAGSSRRRTLAEHLAVLEERARRDVVAVSKARISTRDLF